MPTNIDELISEGYEVELLDEEITGTQGEIIRPKNYRAEGNGVMVTFFDDDQDAMDLLIARLPEYRSRIAVAPDGVIEGETREEYDARVANYKDGMTS